MMKIVFLLLFTITLSACSHFGGENVTMSVQIDPMDNVEEMADFATHIIRGEIIHQRVEWIDFTIPREVSEQMLREEGLSEEEIQSELEGLSFEQQEPEVVTISRVRVLEVFQGDHYVGEEIEIMQSGGEIGNVQWTLEGSEDLYVNSEYALFLFSWEHANFPYALISHTQGAYYIPQEAENYDHLSEVENKQVELETVNEQNDVTLTVEDLIEIAEENDLLHD